MSGFYLDGCPICGAPAMDVVDELIEARKILRDFVKRVAAMRPGPMVLDRDFILAAELALHDTAPKFLECERLARYLASVKDKTAAGHPVAPSLGGLGTT